MKISAGSRLTAAVVASTIVVSGVMVGWAPVPVPASLKAEPAAAVVPVAPPPLGVSGTPKGEAAKSPVKDDRVMLEPPSDAKPVNESLEDRLKRERDATPEPPVRGYDKDRSVEDPSGRSRFGTTFNNVDGTQTTVLNGHAVHFESNGRWEKIDARVERAANGEWVTKANDHVARFSTSWIELASGKGRIRTAPVGVVLPEPVVSADGLMVTYPAVWPGIDLRYRLLTDGVKEEIVVSSAAALPVDGRFAFDVTGPGLKLEAGVPRIEGDLGSDVFFGGVEVLDRTGAPISTPAVVSLTVDGRRNGAGADKIDTLSVGVDPVWAAGLPASAWPIIVDPTTYWGPSIQNAEADSAAPGTPDLGCPTNIFCNHSRVGNQAGGFGDIFWRTGVGYDYSAMLPTSTVASQLYSATLRLSYAGGTTSSQPIEVRHATSYNYCGTNVGGNCANAYQPIVSPLQNLGTGYIDYDVHGIVNPYWYANAPTVGFALSSSENPGGYSYKEIDTALFLTYDRLPIITASSMSPGNPHTFHSSASGVHLSINQLADPDLETLYYRFVLCTAGCTTIADDSGWDTIGSPDASPWDYYSSLWPPGPGLTAWFYNQQLYWTVMVSNSPTGAGFVSYAPQWNQWMLVNNCPAAPAMSDPAGTGAGGFVWSPNNPPTLTITPNLDPDGDWVRYRFIVREQGSTGLLYTSDWSPSQGTAAPISHTLPADLSLQPGVTYEWSAEAQDDPTYFHWYHYQGNPCSAASSFRKAEFEARLGAGGPSPTQTLGPVSVNLATGNVTTAVTTPQVSTLGGSMGASMAYNSRANDIGLQARLYNDTNNNTVPEATELATSRVDREMSFRWTSPGAAPGIGNFVGTWTGYLTVPTAGTTVNDTTIHQGGLLRLTVDPVAQTGNQIVTEQVYDPLGRVVGSRRGTQVAGAPTWETTWACTTYDTRHRMTSVSIPNAAGTANERVITTGYAVGNDPRKTSVTDPAGTITTEVDLLGRMVRYTDVWGTVTANTYDATGEPGRLSSTTLTTSTAVLAATHTYDYDRAGRLSRQYLDGSTIAIPTYNPAGNANEHTLASISYPSGTGNLGNNTSLAALGRNSNGAVTSQTWNQGTTAFFTNTVTRSRTGRVITDTTAGNTSSYEYDTAGRLIKATQPGHVYQYGYGAQTGCTGANLLANAGANTNRTSLIDNGTTIATSCYDTSDRLVSTTQAGYTGTIAYDNHGNTTTLAGETLTYDGADRHTSTVGNGVTVTYTRDALDRIVARTSPGAGAVPVWRGAGTAANNAAGSTSLTLTRPTAAVVNDMLLAVVTTAGATVTAPAGWTQAGVTSNTGVRTTVFWKAATGADPANWAFTLASSQKAAGRIVAYSGVHTTSPIDTTGSAATVSGTSHAAPRVMTTGANRMILTVASVATNTTFTPAASTTERVDNAGTAGAPTVTVEVAQASQAAEAKSAQRTATSAVAAVGATMTIALRPVNAGSQTVRYSYSAAGDATTLAMTTANAVIDRTITLPGGLTLTRRSTTHNTWAYPNIHGDTTYTLDHNGQIAGPYLYDPYGVPLAGHAETSPGDFDNGWLGQHQRPTEHTPELRTTIEMGARPYRPELGRFLRVDPFPGGTATNSYGYVADPINFSDLSGMLFGIKCGVCKSAVSVITDVADVVAIVPGPIGDIASVVGAAGHLAQGEYKEAAMSMAGVLLPIGSGAMTKKLAGKSDEALRASKTFVRGSSRYTPSRSKLRAAQISSRRFYRFSRAQQVSGVATSVLKGAASLQDYMGAVEPWSRINAWRDSPVGAPYPKKK